MDIPEYDLITDKSEVMEWALGIAQLDHHIWGNIENPCLTHDSEHIWRLWTERGYVSLAVNKYHRILGMLCAFPTDDPKTYYLHKVMVTSDYRRQGIASHLLKVYANFLDENYKISETMIRPEDESISTLLGNFNFKYKHYHESYFRSKEDRLLLRREGIEEPTKVVTLQEEQIETPPPITDPFHPLLDNKFKGQTSRRRLP